MMLLLFSVVANAQNLQADSLTVKHRIKLNGYRLTGVSDDTTTANQDSSKVMTERAIKSMVLGRAASRDVQIAAKINYSDSAGMLAAYQAALNTLTANILLRLKYTDSSGMLSAYQSAINANTASLLLKVKYTDTASMLSAYQSLINLRMKYTDTSGMLSAYQSGLLARLKYTDTSGILAAYQSAINLRLKYTDTAGMLAAYQTALNARQATLVSATNIKTINGNSILGSGNLTINAGLTGNGKDSLQFAQLAFWNTSNSILSSPPLSKMAWDTINNTLLLGGATAHSGYSLYNNGNTYFNGNFNVNATASSIQYYPGSGLQLTGTTNGIGISATNQAISALAGNTTNSQYPFIQIANNYGGVCAQFLEGSVLYPIGFVYPSAIVNIRSGAATYNNTITPSLLIDHQNGYYASGGGLAIPFYMNYFNGSGNPIYANTGAISNIWVANNVSNPISAMTLKAYSSNLGTNEVMRITGNKTVLIDTTIDNGIDALQISGSASATSFKSTATQTTLSGGSSGTAIFSQPLQGTSLKKVIIYCNALNGATSTYTFPTAFTNTPAIVATNGLASSVVTTLTYSTMVVTGSTSTGIVILEGY